MIGNDLPPSADRPGPRRMRLTLRWVMMLVIFFALSTTVVLQALRLRESRAREEQLRAEMELERARAMQAQATAMQAEYQMKVRMAQDALPEGSDPPGDR